ncbi:hypothetical protein BV25DRAFT_1816712 [Artomyces pyxidatus]|uniref:Uncharacterized protein n=1 Tax=Artomyces pyxidatus TaxID=48021 RepID=A0ACB8SFL5_9AGAM|nr:hypothetical protein BV25DRAFT_1816712 [Artomyces pyxidatus]
MLDQSSQRLTADNVPSLIEDIELTRKFIRAVQEATLDDNKLDADTLDRLRNPPRTPPDIDDPDVRISIDIYLATTNASQDTYKDVRTAILRRYPDSRMLSYDLVKKRVSELSGVVSIVDDMCINACISYSGPFSDLEVCPTCRESRWDQIKLASSRGKMKVARQVHHTIPVGPQLQARRRSPEMATQMQHRALRTEAMFADFEKLGRIAVAAYEDVYHGRDLIEAVRNGSITSNDTVLLFSIDGAQLYQHKVSDVWIYIWVILDLSPDLRYKKKHILPGGFMMGKPKNMDSFIFRGVQHVSALQKEGLRTWDAAKQALVVDRPYVAFGAADTPAMALLDGMVGHSGRCGCRFYCTLRGRHKRGAPHYYPACLKPDLYHIPGCDHDDVSLRSLIYVTSAETETRYKANLDVVVKSSNSTQYKKNRLETGICKPSLFSGLPRFLGIPAGFPADLMHLASLNLTDLLLSLWRGTIDCDKRDDKATWGWFVLEGDTWKTHGRKVAAATPYLPGSFDRPPRNPAEKMSSGYKAWEFLMYVYGLGPALLYGVLPDQYWGNYCKLVYGIRILHQFVITLPELRSAQKALIEFSEEFELLYYQRKAERLHFCRQSVHQAPHLAPETVRIGPLGLVSQWVMERTIGDLGQEVRQPSNFVANLSQRGLRRAEVNALKAMIPDLEPDTSRLPRGSVSLGAEYVLLRAMDTCARAVRRSEAEAIRTYLDERHGQFPSQHTNGWIRNPVVTRWARLRLPNGQVARSAWKELCKPLGNVRMSRNVKVSESVDTVAVVALYGPPDEELLQVSSQTVWLAPYLGETGLVVVKASSILSVVAMVPYKNIGGPEHASGYIEGQRYFLVEKPGLDIMYKAVGEELEDE